MFTHVVLFKLKDEAQIEETIEKLRSLEGNVPTLRGIEVGRDIVRSERSFDIALITRFDNLAGMEAYQVHPTHVAVLTHMRSVMSEAKAVDFEA